MSIEHLRHRSLRICIATVILAIAAIACGTAEQPLTAGQDASPQPEATEEPIPGFQRGYSFSVAGDDPPAEGLLMISDLVAIGTVVEILPPEWTTPDGRRPDDPDKSVPAEFMIVTPVIVQLEGSPLFNRRDETIPDGRLVIAQLGGQVGGDLISVGLPWDDFTVGQQMLIGVSTHTIVGPDGLLPTSVGPGWSVEMSWVLSGNGYAVSYNGARDSATLIASIEEAVRNPSAPTR